MTKTHSQGLGFRGLGGGARMAQSVSAQPWCKRS